MAKRFSTGGAGYNVPRSPKHSKVLYGHLLDPKKPDDSGVIINDKMIQDQVRTSRKCGILKGDFIQAMQQYANHPNIAWKEANSKADFLRDCDRIWEQVAAA